MAKIDNVNFRHILKYT